MMTTDRKAQHKMMTAATTGTTTVGSTGSGSTFDFSMPESGCLVASASLDGSNMMLEGFGWIKVGLGSFEGCLIVSGGVVASVKKTCFN